MTQALIATIVGVVVSFLVEVIPGFKLWWSEFAWKRLALLGLFLVVPEVWWALACYTKIGVPGTGLDCDVNGAIMALVVGFIGFMSSQGTFKIATSSLVNAQLRNRP